MTDLTKITTPFGLLDAETQEALRAHGGPYERFIGSGVWREEDAQWISTHTYRVKPQPPKPREFWLVGPTVCASKDEAELVVATVMANTAIIHVSEVL